MSNTNFLQPNQTKEVLTKMRSNITKTVIKFWSWEDSIKQILLIKKKKKRKAYYYKNAD